MTDKQIIDYCENYSKESRCYNTFDGSCSKEECFTYRLLQLLQVKEQECERLKKEVSLLKESNSKLQQIEDVNSLEKCYLQQLDQLKEKNEKLEQTLADIKEIAKNFIKNVSDRCVETTPMYGVHKQILQKISEVK